jgi:O-antigen/teichoic acid export membrane protein
MDKSLKNIVSGSVIGLLGKIIAGVINFISLPILLAIYGKANYGLIGVALSANSFLQIINLGVPIGAVKHFSQWVEAKDYGSLRKGIQSNLFFFTVVGIINTLILIYVGIHADSFFQVSDPSILQRLIYFLAFTSFINWYFISFQHLLLAYEKMSWVNFSASVGSFLNIIALVAAYFFHASLETYFYIYIGTSLVSIPLNLYAASSKKIIRKEYFLPILRKSEFKLIMNYSLALFSIGFFQIAVDQAQPIILSTLNVHGDVAVANYKILQNITLLITMISGIFLQNILPYASKLIYRSEGQQVKTFVLNTTRWLSIFIFFVCFLVANNSSRILSLYVGKSGEGLNLWLSIWAIALMFHINQGISSIILGKGEFKALIKGVAIASIISIAFSFFTVSFIGVGIAGLAYLIYKVIEAFFVYGYYLPKIVGLSFRELFVESIFKPLIAALVCVAISKLFFSLYFNLNDFNYLLLSCLFALVFYIVFIFFYVLKPYEKVQLVKWMKMLVSIFLKLKFTSFGYKYTKGKAESTSL